MSEKIVLIDGHSILNRAFYGLPDLTNGEGIHTNAVIGFLNIMFKILEEEKPEYLTVAFDVHAPTFRHEMYEAYKGTRKPMPEELRQQVPLMKEMLTAMGIRIVEQPGLEADDILGTIAFKAEAEGKEAVIVSGDRDLLQLATEHIKIRIPKTKKTGTEIEDYYEKDVIEKYKVTPTQFIDMKALMGDASDNIPGVPGIGEKTASAIIEKYGSIEAAHADAENVKPPRASKNIVEYYEQAQMSKVLATIETNGDIAYRLEEARIGDLFTQEAYVLCKRLEFKNLLNRFEKKEIEENKDAEKFHFVTDFNEADTVYRQAAQSDRLAVCIMNGNGYHGMALTFGEASYYIQEEGFLTEQYQASSLAGVMKKVPLLLTDDLKKLLHFLKENGEDISYTENCYDTTLAAYLLNPLKNEYLYDNMSKDFLDKIIPSKEDLFGKVKEKDAPEKIPEAFAEYSCYHSLTVYRTWDILREKLEKEDMWKLYQEMELPLVGTLFDMEEAGVRVDGEELKLYGEQLKVRIAEVEKAIYEAAGETFNINSPKQLGEVLFEHLKLPNGKKTKTGYSTAADILEKLAPEYPIVNQILEYRQLTKLNSTYAEGLAAYIKDDGRIHSTFNQTITATGRISSTEPNLQNIPIRMELGRLIRKVFIPKDGYVLIDADYSQIELRVLAHMSDDERLIQAYKEAQDIHRVTASQVFHIPFDEVTSLQRRNAKAVNFGIVYGISSFGLSQDLSISKKEAADYIEKYFETYPGIKHFLDKSVEDAKTTGYSITMFGRKRPMPELQSSNFMQRSFGERVAMNAPIQGTAADIIKIAMIRVNQRLKQEGLQSKLILQVHDELLIEAKTEEVEVVKQILAEEMHHAAELQVPLEIDMNCGVNWYEAH